MFKFGSTNIILIFAVMLDITTEIKKLVKTFKTRDGVPLRDINCGYCYDFAEEIVNNLGGEKEGDETLVVLTSDMFLGAEDEETMELLWGKEDLLKVVHDAIWSKKMLRLYGTPSNIEHIYDLVSHGWVFYNGKHYDAACPNGVEYWYELPIYKRSIKKFK